MKNLSEDPLENLFENRFADYEKPAAMEPLQGVLSRLSSQQLLSRIYMAIIFLFTVAGIFTFQYYKSSPNTLLTTEKASIASIPETTISPTQKTESVINNQIENTPATLTNPQNSLNPNSGLSRRNHYQVQTKNTQWSTSNIRPIVEQPIENINEAFILNSLRPKELLFFYQPPIPSHLSRIRTKSDKEIIVRKIRKKTRSSFHTQVLPMLLYNVVTPNKNDDLFIRDFVAENTISTQRIALRTSLNYEYKISEKLRLTTGVSFLYKKLSFSYKTVSYETDSTTSTTHIPGVGFEVKTLSIDTLNNDQNISLTSQNIGGFVGVIYQLNRRHQIGLSFELQKHLDSGKANHEEQLGIVDRSFIYLHYLYEHPLNDKFILNIQPTLSYSFNSVNSSSPITVKPYGIGLGIGLKYKLFKNKKVKQTQKEL